MTEKSGSGFVRNGNTSVQKQEQQSTGKSADEKQESKSPKSLTRDEARRKNPYYDNGGGCNW